MSGAIPSSTHLDLHGAASPPAGMEDALDEQRAASMADEGGASAMTVEAQTPRPASASRFPRWAVWVGAGVGVGLGVAVLGYLRSRRGV